MAILALRSWKGGRFMTEVERASLSKELDAAAAAARRGRLRYYVEAQSTGPGRYVLEQSLFFLLRGIPSIVGIGLRGIMYRLILKSKGSPVIEDRVRLCQPANIRLGRRAYLDHGTYLHACPQGIAVSDDTRGLGEE